MGQLFCLNVRGSERPFTHCNRGRKKIPLALWLARVYSKHWASADQKGQLPASQKEPQSMVIMLDNLKQCISLIYHAAIDESAPRPIKESIGSHSDGSLQYHPCESWWLCSDKDWWWEAVQSGEKQKLQKPNLGDRGSQRLGAHT